MDYIKDMVVILEKTLEQGDFDKLNNQIKEIISRFGMLLQSMNLEQIGKEVQQNKIALSYNVRKEYVQQNIHFIFGRYIGYLDALNEYVTEEIRKKSVRDSIGNSDISEIPHVNDIINTIHNNEGIRHGKLAELVGIEKSTLTGIMDKLVEKEAVCFTRPGKYKYYYLTDIGRKYFDDNQVTIQSTANIESLTEQLLLALSKEDDVNSRIIQVLTNLVQGKGKFKGYTSSTKEKINIPVLMAELPKIHPVRVAFPDTDPKIVNDGFAVSYKIDNSSIDNLDTVILSYNSGNNMEGLPQNTKKLLIYEV